MYEIDCRGKSIDLTSPIVMGILNLTPDSFYDGGVHTDMYLNSVEKMLSEGATFIDIGGMSTRPNSEEVSIEEELVRVVPAIVNILKRFPDCNISIDSYRHQVVKSALDSGACLINDISGDGFGEDLASLAAEYKVPYVLMHIKGKPRTMQVNPTYENVVEDVMIYFENKISELKIKGVQDIILDLGFGFGKTIDHNYDLLKNIEKFKKLNMPTMAALSRKSMIYKVLESSPSEALNGTSILHTIALMGGANILRAHDVKEAIECIKLCNKF
jgi:dihydropteroate synthase